MRTRRLLGAAALTTIVAAGLAGCVKMDMQLELQSDDTVDGSMVFAVSSALAEMTGQDPETLLEGMDTGELVDEGAVTRTEPYDDGEYVGSTIYFEGETLDSFAGSGTGDDMSIVREGDEFVVTGTMDLSEEALGGMEEGGEMVAGLMEGFDIQISVTFPGEVSEHDGTLDGNTVTWTPEYGQLTEINARGSAIEGGGGSSLPLPLLIGIGAAVLLAIALILFFVLRSRKNAAAPAPATAYGDQPAYGAPAAFTPDAGYSPTAPTAPAPPVAPAPPAAAPAPEPPAPEPPAPPTAQPPQGTTPPPPPA